MSSWLPAVRRLTLGQNLGQFECGILPYPRVRDRQFSPAPGWATADDGSAGLWSIPADGGNPTRLVAYDDPSLDVGYFSVGPEHFYVTFDRNESDIRVVDLEW